MFGVRCVRSPNSVMGYAESWLKKDGVLFETDSMEDAEAEALRCRERAVSPNVGYFAEEL